jgi:hypothetical protein
MPAASGSPIGVCPIILRAGAAKAVHPSDARNSSKRRLARGYADLPLGPGQNAPRRSR